MEQETNHLHLPAPISWSIPARISKTNTPRAISPGLWQTRGETPTKKGPTGRLTGQDQQVQAHVLWVEPRLHVLARRRRHLLFLQINAPPCRRWRNRKLPDNLVLKNPFTTSIHTTRAEFVCKKLTAGVKYFRLSTLTTRQVIFKGTFRGVGCETGCVNRFRGNCSIVTSDLYCYVGGVL